MSSTNTDSATPDIDAAKSVELPTSTYFQNIRTFIYDLAKKIFHVFIYVIIASMILYSCKVSQSSLIPSDTGCMPYESNNPTIKVVKTNIFETFFSDPQLSEKLVIPYEKENKKNILLDLIRGAKEKSDVSSITSYFISIIESVISFNYSAFEIFFNILNKMPEFLILLLGPFIAMIYVVIVVVVDNFYFMITWFTQMKWFFKKNLNDTKSGNPEWESVTLENDSFEFGISFWMVIFFVILGIFVLPLLAPIISIIIPLYCFLSIAGYTGYLNGKPAGIFTIIKGVFTNYKVYISIIISLIVISTAYTILGTGGGVGAITAVILIYFGIIAINIYSPIQDKNLTIAVPTVEATKVYTPVQENDVESKQGLFSFFGGQSGGGAISNKLKKFNKLYNNINKS